MSELYNQSLNEFIEKAASNSPTPGGGNVSAVIATLAASMVSMVANLTIGKKGYEEVQDKAKKAADDLKNIIEDLKTLTEKDMAVFSKFMEALRMPKDTDEQKAKRTEAMQQAAKTATEVPMEICRKCLEILKISVPIASYGNKGAISDAGVGAYVAEAALRAAMLSVDINLPGIKDAAFVEKYKAERRQLFADADEMKLIAVAKVKERM
jgi:formiminotetrahydrofolate cyclodeaminase